MLDTIVPVSPGTNGCPEKSGADQANVLALALALLAGALLFAARLSLLRTLAMTAGAGLLAAAFGFA
jgi:hypothetical protein